MSSRIRNSRILFLLLYAALFVVSEVISLRFGQKDPAMLSTGMIPVLYALVVAAVILAVALMVIERGKRLLWGVVNHVQFLLCFVPVVLHLIATMQRQMAGAGMQATFTTWFDGNLLAYAMIPLNAICIILYYVWCATTTPTEAR